MRGDDLGSAPWAEHPPLHHRRTHRRRRRPRSQPPPGGGWSQPATRGWPPADAPPGPPGGGGGPFGPPEPYAPPGPASATGPPPTSRGRVLGAVRGADHRQPRAALFWIPAYLACSSAPPHDDLHRRGRHHHGFGDDAKPLRRADHQATWVLFTVLAIAASSAPSSTTASSTAARRAPRWASRRWASGGRQVHRRADRHRPGHRPVFRPHPVGARLLSRVSVDAVGPQEAVLAVKMVNDSS